jgi:hypothetical protein
MKNSAFVIRSHIRNVVLCSLLTFGLAACGVDEGSSSSGTASTGADSIPSVVTPGIGVIDRTSETSAPNPTPVSSTTSSSSTTAVASNNKTATIPSTPPKSSTTSTGTATLDWTPPTENTDGSVLTNLAGYTVYYGTSPSNLTQSVKITNPGLSAYTMSDLPAGTWYFAVTSSSSTGIESNRSGIVSATI